MIDVKLMCVVTQGSVLGPVLFLLYVNEMSQAVECDLLLFGDDSSLLFTGKDLIPIENLLK